jgi:hypothetical protein
MSILEQAFCKEHSMRPNIFVGLLIILVFISVYAKADDFVRLRDGQVVRCAVLRMDTLAVFTTDWEYRDLAMPPLKVYERREIESVWMLEPSSVAATRIPYVPHTKGWEVGGSAAFQTYLTPDIDRRYLIMASIQGSFTVTKYLSLEIDGDYTAPISKQSDVWHSYKNGYELSLNAVAHPIRWHEFVPFVLVGGGGSTGPAPGKVQLTTNDNRDLLNAGLGLKWGSGGIGYRLEWRHSFYQWREGKKNKNADASAIRASIFLYK